MSSGAVSLERDGPIAMLRFDRPAKLNALDRAMYGALNRVIAEFDADPELRCAVIAANGRAFCAGVDLLDLRRAMAERPNMRLSDLMGQFDIDAECRESTSKPIICAIHGACYGNGLTFALACDIRIATPNSTFCLPEVKAGIASIHGTLRSVRMLGIGRALELLLTGDPRDAEWALATGLINQIVPAGELLARAVACAKAIAAIDPVAIKATRAVAYAAQHATFEEATKIGVAMRPQVLDEGYAKARGGADVAERLV